jgi:hypothetical protein
MSASYQTEEADRITARRVTENTGVPTMAMTDIAQERATPQNPPLHSLTMPSAAAAQIIAINGHQEVHGASVLEGAMAPNAEQVEQASTQPRLAGDLPEEYLIFLFPIALFVVFAVFAAIIAWS